MVVSEQRPIGRPKADWHEPATLPSEPAGAAVIVDASIANHRIRASILDTSSADDAVVLLLGDGREIVLDVAAVRRWRPIPSMWVPDDFVVQPHLPEEQWRGVVLDVEYGRALVLDNHGETAWWRDGALRDAFATEAPPPLKHGPVARDSLRELLFDITHYPDPIEEST